MILKRIKYILTVVLLLNANLVSSQNRNSIWCFGDSAGIDFANLANPVAISTGLDTRGSCTSISDSLGNLLFYSNTRANGSPGLTAIIYNRNHVMMLNGDSIEGLGWYQELVIIPYPGDHNKYYLFSTSTTLRFGFYYSIIDMRGDSGLGEVIAKNVVLHNDSLCEALAAAKHGNGRDWWVILKKYSANGDSTFYEYLITPDTIFQRVLNIGGISYTNFGKLFFSKDGNKLGFVNFAGLIETFDFDRCSGDFSNAKIIHPQFSINYAGYFGAEFSRSAEMLYISDGQEYSSLFQFDLTSTDVWNSSDTLMTLSTTRYGGGYLKRGPDDKIYWSCGYYVSGPNTYPYNASEYYTENMNLSVINDPDILGSGCNLNMYSFYLGGKRTYWGLPNNPDYEMGSLSGSVCDTLTNSINTINDFVFSVFPNPVISGEITFTFLELSREAEIILEDVSGRVVARYKVDAGNAEFKIKLPTLASGIYLAQLKTRATIAKIKFVVE